MRKRSTDRSIVNELSDEGLVSEGAYQSKDKRKTFDDQKISKMKYMYKLHESLSRCKPFGRSHCSTPRVVSKKMGRSFSVCSSVASHKSQVSAKSILMTKSRKSDVTITLTCNLSVGGFGKMLNQYKLGAVLGLGSYGKVKCCTD